MQFVGKISMGLIISAVAGQDYVNVWLSFGVRDRCGLDILDMIDLLSYTKKEAFDACRCSSISALLSILSSV